jgi:regulator of protease activity HflC (stomatin/prohibitin superfamily)
MEVKVMFGFFKGQPSDYVLRFSGGRLAAEGQGLTFWYLAATTTIATIPTGSCDIPFVFHEQTGSFQDVTVQGQYTYRITNPRRTAELLDFSIHPLRGEFRSDDPQKLAQRITNLLQTEVRRAIQQRSLEAALQEVEAIATEVVLSLQHTPALEPLGVELLSLSLLAIRPTPEVGRALEARYRESLLCAADEAIYARRAAAVEEERKIKENELATEILLEQQRQQFIALQGENLEREAQFKAQALRLELESYQSMDPRLLLALAARELGQNAGQLFMALKTGA